MVNPAYARLEATAQRLIGKWGKPATIVREERSGPPHAPVVVPVSHPVKLVETGYSITNRNDTLIQTGDKVGLINTEADVTPELSDAMEIGGLEYHIVDLQPLNPGGRVLLFEFVARR